MKKKIISVIKYLVFLGIGIFLIWWQIGKMTELEKETFLLSLKNTNYIYIIPVLIMALLSHFSRALRWKILIETMGYKTSTANAFYATMCGYFANTFVPRAGEILKCSLITKYDKIPFTKLVGTIITERLFDLGCYFLLILITIAIQVNTVSQFLKEKIQLLSPNNHSTPLWVKILLPLSILILLYFFGKWVLKRYREHRYFLKIKGVAIGVKEGFSSILHLKKRKAFIGHTIFIWAMYLLQIYIGFSALSETSHLGIGAAFSVLSLSTLAMIIAPGGLGAFPVAVQQVLLIYGLDNISFGWLMWGVTTAIILAAGLISFGLILYTNRHKNEKNGQHLREDNISG
jgi:hypothetical protein